MGPIAKISYSFGDKSYRDNLIDVIYSTQIEALKNAGLYIEKEELKELYDKYNYLENLSYGLRGSIG